MTELSHFHVNANARRLVNEVLDSGRLTYGPMSKRFEAMWGRLHLNNPVFVNSGTSALQLCIQALGKDLGWKPGAEIIVPAITFVATINAILHNNYQPVVVDVDDKMGMDPEDVRDAISDNTVAVVPVHILGRPCDMTEIMEIAADECLAVIEDSCEAVGAKVGDVPVGGMGDMSAFSTYAAHLVVTGVGGFACAKDKRHEPMLRSLANHGRDTNYLSIDDGQDPETRWKVVSSRFKFDHVGHSYRATELEAALGIAQLEQWHNTAASRRQIGFALDQALEQDFMVGYNEKDFIIPMNYPIHCPTLAVKDKVVHALESEGVQTRDIVSVLNQPCYDFDPRILWGHTPNAKRIYDTTLYVGCHQAMGLGDVEKIASVVRRERANVNV